MTNNTNIIIAIAAADLSSKSVKELRVVAQQAGIVGYSKLRKAELVEALTPLCKPEAAPVVVKETKLSAKEALARLLVASWVYNSTVPFKDGKRLFFKANKYPNWISCDSRLAVITGAMVEVVKGRKPHNKAEFQVWNVACYKLMEKYGFCHTIPAGKSKEGVDLFHVHLNEHEMALINAQNEKLLNDAHAAGFDKISSWVLSELK